MPPIVNHSTAQGTAPLVPPARVPAPLVPGHEILMPTPMAKGNYYLSNKQYQEALQIFTELVEKEPSNNYVFRSLALVWNGLGQFKEGEDFLRNYLTTHPDSDSAMYGLGFLYYLEKSWDESEKYLNKAIAIYPENALALNNMGALYAQQKKFSEAEAFVKKAMGYSPSELMFYTNLFGVYTQAGISSQFEMEFHQHIKTNTADIARGYGILIARHKRQKGFQLYSQGKLQETINTFLELLQIYNEINRETGIIATLFSLGVLYEEQGDKIKAKESFNKVLIINPLHLQAQERLKNLKKE